MNFEPRYRYSDVDPKKMAAVSALTPADRYKYFIKEILKAGMVYALCMNNRWAVLPMPNGSTAFLLWPASAYAEEYRLKLDHNNNKENWHESEPRFIYLTELMETLLPQLKQDRILPGVFFTTFEYGVTPAVDDFSQEVGDYQK